MPTDNPPSGQSPTDTAPFVFNGTLVDTGASTMAHLSAEGASVVVVDEVLQAPDVLRHIAGQKITVYGVGDRVQAGGSATFYTDGLAFGESVAVHAADVRPLVAAQAETAAAADPAGNLHAQRAQERFDAADLVVSGRVVSVSAPEPAGAVAAAAAAFAPDDAEAPTDVRRISEHEPLWNDARIQVDEVHKGEAPGGEVVIRFPSSHDVKWFRAPKFEPGQEGVFILHRDEPKAVAAGAMMAAVADAPQVLPYTALDPADFHPADAPDAIQSVLERNR